MDSAVQTKPSSVGADAPNPGHDEKVCITSRKQKQLHIVSNHLKKEDVQLFPPTFTFGDDFPGDAICLLGSTLYFFDSYYGGAFVTNLAGANGFTNMSYLRILTKLLTKIPDLHHAKLDPIAIVTPDKKRIFVCSRVIWRFPFDDDTNPIDFEMFDPDGNGGVGLWHQFVGMPYSWKSRTMYNDQIWIEKWAFVDEHVLLFKTGVNRDILFTIDIRYPDQPCRRLSETVYNDILFNGDGFCRLVGSVSDLVYDKKNESGDETEDENEYETDDAIEGENEIDDEHDNENEDETDDEN